MARLDALRDGVLNIWVAPTADPAAAKPLTTEKTRPIRTYYWAPDAKSVLFINDKGGDENFLLYGVGRRDRRGEEPYTVREDTGRDRQHQPRGEGSHLVGLNNRDARWHDVYSLDLADGQLTLVMQNDDGFAGYVAATSS